MNLEFSQQFKKNTRLQNFMKLIPLATELFLSDERTDGRTDRRI